jgi:hypothetical protein
VLLNSRGCCLFQSAEDNPRSTPADRERLRDRTRPSEGRDAVQFAGRSPAFDAVLAGQAGGALEHRDPILEDGQRYLTGYAPISEFGGGTLVQSNYEDEMRPTRDFNAQLRLWGGLLFAAAFALLLGLWSWFFRILRTEERRTHA